MDLSRYWAWDEQGEYIDFEINVLKCLTTLKTYVILIL